MKHHYRARIMGLFALILCFFQSTYPVFASEGVPVIEMGTFANVAEDRQEVLDAQEISQPPLAGDVIGEGRTALATKTKWTLTPSFNVAQATSTDPKIVKVSKKKDAARSTRWNKWYSAKIRVKKAGRATVTLEGNNGEKAVYEIYAEAPKIVKEALKVTDRSSVSMSSYLSGLTYLRPVSVTARNTQIVSVSGDYTLNISGNGTTRIVVQCGRRKVMGTVRAKLPAFTKKSITLTTSPVQLTWKDLPADAKPVYRSSDPSIAKVNSSGFVAPVKAGTAAITASVGNITASCSVTVKQ